MAGGQRQTLTAPYYGWFVLAASAVTELLIVGATSYGAGLFVLPVQAEFGLSRADASSALLIVNLGAIFMAPSAGRALDRYPIRAAISVGALCYALGMAVIALTSSLKLMVLALLFPAAVGFSLLGPMTTATLASRWFFRRRGLAMGIAAVATSGGGFVVVPLLSKAIEAYGWRGALLGEAGVFIAVIIPLTLLVLRDNPFRAGLGKHPENMGRQDGEALMHSHAAGGPERADKLWHVRKILGRREFWAPPLLFAVVSNLCQAIVISAPPYGHQLQFSAASSAFLISAFSIAAALTKVTVGVMADYWDRKILLFAAAAFMVPAQAILCLLTSYPALLLACCLAGISLGGVLPASAALLANRFGAARFGSVMGWTYFFVFASTIAVVRFTGTMFDLTGTYHAAFVAFLGLSVLAWFAALAIDFRAGGENCPVPSMEHPVP